MFERIEHGAYELICGDSADDRGDRAKIQASLLAAAGIGPHEAVAVLAGVLTGSLLIPGVIATTAATILVSRLVMPAAANVGAALEPRVTAACGAWSRRLAETRGQQAAPAAQQLAGTAPASSEPPARQPAATGAPSTEPAGTEPLARAIPADRPLPVENHPLPEAAPSGRGFKLSWRPREDTGGARTFSKTLPAGAIVTAGRQADREIVLDDERVSRAHARLEVGEDGIAVTDLGSKNGTFIGEKPITSAIWLPGQTLRIGIFQFTAEFAADTSSGGKPSVATASASGLVRRIGSQQ